MAGGGAGRRAGRGRQAGRQAGSCRQAGSPETWTIVSHSSRCVFLHTSDALLSLRVSFFYSYLLRLTCQAGCTAQNTGCRFRFQHRLYRSPSFLGLLNSETRITILRRLRARMARLASLPDDVLLRCLAPLSQEER